MYRTSIKSTCGGNYPAPRPDISRYQEYTPSITDTGYMHARCAAVGQVRPSVPVTTTVRQPDSRAALVPESAPLLALAHTMYCG